MTSGLAFRPSKSNSIYGLGSQFSGSYPARSSPPSFSFHVPRSPRARRSLLVLTTHQSTSFLLWLMSAFRAANVSTRLKGRQFHRYGGGHSEEKLPFGHTTPLVRSADETLPHAEFGKFRSNINANRYPPAHPTGERVLKGGARGGCRGSIPWPGGGRSQRTRDPIGR